MWVNIWTGFITPWILGLWLLKKDKKLIFSIVPFVCIIATLVCLWGDYKKFWVVKPKLKNGQFLTTMPFNFGFYPILSVLMIYLIKKTEGRKSLWIVIIFSFLTTFAEFCGVLFKKVKYYNDWNIIKTFFSYLVPYYFVYIYYLWINRQNKKVLNQLV